MAVKEFYSELTSAVGSIRQLYVLVRYHANSKGPKRKKVAQELRTLASKMRADFVKLKAPFKEKIFPLLEEVYFDLGDIRIDGLSGGGMSIYGIMEFLTRDVESMASELADHLEDSRLIDRKLIEETEPIQSAFIALWNDESEQAIRGRILSEQSRLVMESQGRLADNPKFIFATNHNKPDHRDLAVAINKALADKDDERSQNQIAVDFLKSKERKEAEKVLGAIRKYERDKRKAASLTK